MPRKKGKLASLPFSLVARGDLYFTYLSDVAGNRESDNQRVNSECFDQR
jgi:hypothetical protein